MATQNLRQVSGLLSRLSKPEKEVTFPWVADSTLKTPSGLRTDKFICFLIFEWVGRIVIANANIAALTVDSIGQLLQEIRLYGQHARFGNQRPIVLRGGFIRAMNAIYRYSYVPRDTFSAAWTGAIGNYDIRAFWVLPLFPLPMSLNLAPLFSIKGPDWAGNLFLEVDCGDALDLGGVAANTSFQQYGGGAGTNPTLNISVVRPNMSVDLMNRVSPGITFKSYSPLESILQGPSIANNTIFNLNIGKRLVSVTTEAGTLFATTAGHRAYSAMSDAMLTLANIALDGKVLVDSYDGYIRQAWENWLGGNNLLTGYQVYNFQRESANPDASFEAETLTSARRFQLWGNVNGAAGQGGVVEQDEVLGTPAVAAATTTTATSS